MNSENYIDSNELSNEEVLAILRAYRSEQIKRNAIGPVISGIFHCLLLLLLSLYVSAKEIEYRPPVEIVSQILEVKPLEEKVFDEIEQIQDELAEDAPQMEVPVISVESIADSALEDVSNEAPETADDFDMDEVMDVVNNPTPLKLSSLYGGRTKAGMAGATKRYGATKGGVDSVDKSLQWLAKVQQEDGSWVSDPAHSGLALLCFLAHGETPLSEQYGVTVQKSIQWLATNMPEGKMWKRAYSHGIATYALSEAYGMTQIPFLISPMESGIDVILKGQQDGGGFDYNYKKGERWDVSVTGWQMQAMKSAYIAGSTNPDLQKGIEKVVNFMKNSAYANSKFGYTSAGEGSQNMTGVGNVGLQLLGEGASKEVISSSKWIIENREKTLDAALVDWQTGSSHLYGWYYDTQAVFQFYNTQKEWNSWNSKFQPLLVRNQNPEGYWTFDKDTHGIGGETLGGKVLSTTLCCLQLEVFYRYLPTFKINHNVSKKEELIKSELLIK